MPRRFPGFPPEALAFLRRLKKNNRRDWFVENKAIYDESVRAPLSDLVAVLGERLAAISPGLEIEPKKAIYRIYRDVRFSANKSPYKTHVAAIFTPKWAPKHAAAGYYFHLSPDELLVGGGLYRPEPPQLLAIRRRLSERADEYRKLVAAAGFRRLFGEVEGEKLKRVPKGFDTDDPAADLLVAKQFLAGSRLDPALAETPRLETEIFRRFKTLTPWIEWINQALR